MKNKTRKIVIVGHVDHGKSTLIGRILLDTGSLPKDKMAELKRISKELGGESGLAYLTDQLKEERENNITIDTTQIFFKSRKRDYCIIDAPGHVEFLKNMITGASLAEAAVLIVDAKEGAMEQTYRHAYLIKFLGIDRIVVAVNKMDLAGYDKDRFEDLKDGLLRFLKGLKMQPDFFIPMSAKQGVNISRRPLEMSWYKGPSLLQALDSVKLVTKALDKPLRFPVQDVYNVDSERIIAGRVCSGVVREGQEVLLLPASTRARIKKIKVFHGYKKIASQGESIGFILEEPVDVNRGDIIVQKEDLPEAVDSFKGNVFWMSDEPLEINKPVTLRCATQEVEGIAEGIEKRVNSSTLETIEEDAGEVRMNEAALVSFRTRQPVIVERFSFIEELGRFTIESGDDLKGAGILE